MPILVCESVRARSVQELVRARDAATSADLVELRLDGLEKPDVLGALAGRRQPVIVTCRPRWEGGGFDGDEETRRRWLEQALAAGADFVDVEWQAPWCAQVIGQWRDRVVLSWHDFTGTPHDLHERAKAMAQAGAAVTKIAVSTTCLQDLERLLQLQQVLPRDRRFVAIGMGPAGVASRILGHRFGSCWTYGGRGVAPGQLPVESLIREFRVRTTTSATALFGVVGRPIMHSLSPAMHNAAFAACRVDAVYVPFEAKDFDDFLWAASALDIVGASVTAPFKSVAYHAAPRVDEEARALGVVNTLRRDGDGSWSGRNTDVTGFLAPLEDTELARTRASVLGAGGAARAVVQGLSSRGATVTVHARRQEAAAALAAHFACAAGDWPPEAGAWDLLVNTTPVGTWPRVEESPVEASILHGRLVYDLVYNPPETALLRAARERGAKTIGGLEMLVRQAAAQFEWWTRHPAPVEVMRTAALQRLTEFREAERAK
jgi:3-dehydroquinate dehydratase/shikimate dehydrogenase